MDGQQPTKKEQESQAANEVGQLARRTAANAATGGAYEKIRKAPVVGGVARYGERKIGKAVSTADRLTGGAIGKASNKIKKAFPNKSAKPTGNEDAGTENANNNATEGTQNNNQKKGLLGIDSATGMSLLKGKQEQDLTGKITAKIKKIVIKKATIFVLPFVLVMLFIVCIIAALDDGGSSGLTMGGYYVLQCPEMTVLDDDGMPIGTFSNKDYVAGVVSAEVGEFNNLEVFKAFAVAARTYGEVYNDSCTIAGNATRQAFTDISSNQDGVSQLIYQAVEETDGIVILEDDVISGSTEYDAFCYSDKDSNNYTLVQKNQEIPTSWVNSHIYSHYYINCPCDLNDESMSSCWKDGHWEDGGHGRGMSQYGAFYLATEENYDYEQILYYYYDGIELSKPSILSIAGLDVKDTSSSTILNTNLSDALAARGSSIKELNTFIKSNVQKQGVGTRAGVVTAAVSLINYLNDGLDARIPYYWNGKYRHVGASATFGGETVPDKDGRTQEGLDCSGFVTWSIINGGYNFKVTGTKYFDEYYGSNSCDVTDSNCVGQPGDIINSKGCHAQLIISVDEASGNYFIAESNGNGVYMHTSSIHASNCGSKETRILRMDDYYNNKANVNSNY